MWKRIVLVLVAVAVAAVLYLQFSELPEPLAADSQSSQMLQPGPYRAASFDLTLVDDTRPTQVNGSFAGADSRELVTRIWYPAELIGKKGEAAASPRPLLIYSHGFMSQRTGGSYQAKHLASHGYIVAAMDYPLTHFGAPGGPLVMDVVNQPGDISFLLDQFLSWNEEPGHQFYGAIDASRIGAFGLSLGGMTSTLVAYHPRLRDERVAAAVSIAGPSFMFADAFFTQRRLPFMMVASDIDAMVEYQSNAAPIISKVDNAILVSIDSASHTGFADAARYLRWLNNADSIGCAHIKENVDAATEEPWFDLIGSPEEGIAHVDPTPLCEMDPLPSAMNPVRQHWLTTLAVASFFQSQFAESAAERARHAAFLREVLPAEQAEVSVQLAAGAALAKSQ